jgi:type IV pilus assembly protein PilB
MNASVTTTVAGNPLLSGLPRALLNGGKITQEQALELSSRAAQAKTQLIDELIQSRLISARELAHYFSASFSLPVLDLDAVDLAQIDEGIIDARVLTQHRVLGLKKREPSCRKSPVVISTWTI